MGHVGGRAHHLGLAGAVERKNGCIARIDDPAGCRRRQPRAAGVTEEDVGPSIDATLLQVVDRRADRSESGPTTEQAQRDVCVVGTDFENPLGGARSVPSCSPQSTTACRFR